MVTRRNCNINIHYLRPYTELASDTGQSFAFIISTLSRNPLCNHHIQQQTAPVSHLLPSPNLPHFSPEQCFPQDCVSVFESADVARVIDSPIPDLGKSSTEFQRCPIFQGHSLKIDIHYSYPAALNFVILKVFMFIYLRWCMVPRGDLKFQTQYDQ